MYLQNTEQDIDSNMVTLALTDDETKVQVMGRLVPAEVKKGLGLC